MRLTPKQQAFCDYYIEKGNATEAAKKAGYSEKTAKVIGTENLSKPYLQEYIQKRLEEISSERIADAEEVLMYLTKVIRREELENVVVTVKSSRSWYDDKGKKNTEEVEEPQIVQIPSRLSDSNKAAELLGKRHMMWTEKKEVSITVPTFVDDIPVTEDE
ncbi:hypothetical protein IIU_05088 [Bacillus cereus VD133]|uniref:Terminase small subunit n=1 Tax=Bacillus cereus VD133 TaxID=1053233 RepID=A0A9W5PN76_BACCE|nr:terminase small subunit [Bacillus cereus]EOO30771.1 hypothetical protein IIU_05088 [Bacillus cereus VD133]